MTRFSLSLSCAFVAFLVLPLAGASAQVADHASARRAAEVTGTPHIELTPDVFDFGEVWQNAPAKQEFTIKNTGDGPLIVTARSSCGCTVPTKPKSPLAAGEATTFTITYTTSRVGKARKRVTLATNDPEQRTLGIDVIGHVKPLFKITPNDRIIFQGLDVDSAETETVKLVNLYPKPIHLKLGEVKADGRFEAEIEEVDAGKEYELVIKTVPPLNNGRNIGQIELKTGLPESPELMIYASAHIMPRVMVNPSRLLVSSRMTRPMPRNMRIQYRADTPIEIKGVETDLEGLEWEILPSPPMHAGRQIGYHQIRVTLPPYKQIPDDGATLTVLTSDESEEFARLEVPIMKRDMAQARRVPKPKIKEADPADIREQIRKALEGAEERESSDKRSNPK